MRQVNAVKQICKNLTNVHNSIRTEKCIYLNLSPYLETLSCVNKFVTRSFSSQFTQHGILSASVRNLSVVSVCEKQCTNGKDPHY